MDTNLTMTEQADVAVKFRLPSLVSLAGPARIAEPAAPRTAQLIGLISWPNGGYLPVPTQAAPQHQDGRFAGTGGCDDVTDMKFSTRLGPPSCSPPV
jgi:hypothetical protein